MTRQVYADCLEERGDSRGEYLHLEMELAELPDGDPRLQELEQRGAQLRARLDDDWLREAGKLFDVWLLGYPSNGKVATIKIVRQLPDPLDAECVLRAPLMMVSILRLVPTSPDLCPIPSRPAHSGLTSLLRPWWPGNSTTAPGRCSGQSGRTLAHRGPVACGRRWSISICQSSSDTFLVGWKVYPGTEQGGLLEATWRVERDGDAYLRDLLGSVAGSRPLPPEPPTREAFWRVSEPRLRTAFESFRFALASRLLGVRAVSILV
jgi:hypothetical protein